MGDFLIHNSVLKRYIGSAKNVVIPDGVTRIGKFAFSACLTVTGITIPSSVQDIDSYAFCDCLKLESIAIPECVTNIGAGAFFGCRGLADEAGFVIVRSCLYDYIGHAQIVEIPDGVTSISNRAFARCNVLTCVTIPEGVNSIGEAVFVSCTGLRKILIPKSVTIIEDMAFSRCPNLTIHAPAGSFADHYAKLYNIPFVKM